MKSTDRELLIQELNKKINEYVSNHNLFGGGCCYAAYVLAKNLKELGISYTTVMYQYKGILHSRRFNTAINGDGVAHVAIEVTYRKTKFIIGETYGIYRFFACTGERYKVCRYKNITPEMLLDGYKNNDWNWFWRTSKNGMLMRSINAIAKKYKSEIC